MSVSVDPFVIPIPPKWMKDPELAPTVAYLWRFLYDLWQRTGAGDDAISNLEVINTYETTSLTGKIAGIYDQFDSANITQALSRMAGQIAVLIDENNQLKTKVTITDANYAALADRLAEIERQKAFVTPASIGLISDRISDIERRTATYSGMIAGLHQRIDHVELS